MIMEYRFDWLLPIDLTIKIAIRLYLHIHFFPALIIIFSRSKLRVIALQTRIEAIISDSH